jgi:hypothetical protein
MGRIWGSRLARDSLGAPGEHQRDEEHDKAATPADRFFRVPHPAIPSSVTDRLDQQPISAGISEISARSLGRASHSLDHLVGAGENRLRDCKAECFGGF